MRLLSIDILRTVAIGMMVLVHFVENLSAHYNSSQIGPASREHIWWLPVGLAAPLFTLLTGVSYHSWITAQEDRGIDDGTISKRSVRRGLVLIGIGFAFNIFVWLPEDTFNWDILTFVGSALIILNLIRKLPTEVLLTGILLVVILSPPLQVLCDYYAFWNSGYFEYDLTLSDLVTGYLVTGYFPLFPWIILPIIGFIIIKTFNLSGFAAGVLLIQCSMPSAVLTYLVGSLYSSKKVVDSIASMIVVSTIMSFITVPITVFFALKYFY